MSFLQELRIIFFSEYSPYYYKLLVIFLIMTFNGILIFASVFRKRNSLLNLGAGMIVGVLSYLLLLGIFSYFLKGYLGFVLLIFFLTVFCFVKGYKNLRIGFPSDHKEKITFLITCLFAILIFLYGRSAPIGGDVSTHWALATSFSRGNYPTVLPWQPQFLTAYHEGAFMIEGAFHSLTGMNIGLIHYFFSIYVISALFIFITGIAFEEYHSVFSFIPSLLGLIIFSGPILMLPNVFNINEVIQIQHVGIGLPDIKPASGSGTNDVGSLYYYNFYVLSLSAFVLILYSLKEKWKTNFKKFIWSTSISVLSLSIMETFFLFEVPLIVFRYLYDYRHISLKTKAIYAALLLVLFAILFLLMQNLIRDSLISGDSGSTHFVFLRPGSNDFMVHWNFTNSVFAKDINTNFLWYLPDLRLILLALVTTSFLKKSYWGLTLGISAGISYFLSVFLNDPYFLTSTLRFANTSYEIVMFGFGFLFLEIFSKKKKNALLLVTILIIFSPQILFDTYSFTVHAITKDEHGLVNYIDYSQPTLSWIEDNIPYEKRVIFVDEYPFESKDSPMSTLATRFHGIFVPSGPINLKLVSVDYAGEWYDAMTSLSPVALSQLKVDYVYIKYTQVNRFSAKRKSQIGNVEYFVPVMKDDQGTLYKVSDLFKKLGDDQTTLQNMAASIPDNSYVYLDKMPVADIRKGLLVDLSLRTHLIGPMYNLGDDYFLYVSANLPMEFTDDPSSVKPTKKEMDNIKYFLTDQLTDPNQVLNTVGFKKNVEINQVVLWER